MGDHHSELLILSVQRVYVRGKRPIKACHCAVDVTWWPWGVRVRSGYGTGRYTGHLAHVRARESYDV